MKSVKKISVFFLTLWSFGVFGADKTVQVTGSCLRYISKDRGAMTLTADFVNKDMKVAAQEATTSYEKVREAVKKLDLKNAELQTSEYSVNEVREWEKNQSVFKGYRARMGLTASTSDLKRLGEIIAIGARNEIRSIGNMVFYVSPEKMKAETEACLEEAAKNAKSKAEKMAGALGRKVGVPLQISESGGGSQPRPMMAYAMADSAGGMEKMAAPTIEAKSESLSVDVSVQFLLE